jgi:hypothetical protein
MGYAEFETLVYAHRVNLSMFVTLEVVMISVITEVATEHSKTACEDAHVRSKDNLCKNLRDCLYCCEVIHFIFCAIAIGSDCLPLLSMLILKLMKQVACVTN